MHALGHRLKTKAKNALRGKSPGHASRLAVDENASDTEISPVPGQPSVHAIQRTADENASNGEVNSVSGQTEPEIDLWQQAFDKLSEKHKQSLSTLAGGAKPAKGPDSDQPASSIIPDLIAQTRARQEECEKRSWRIKYGRGPADEIILRDQAALIISWLTKAGDIGVSFAPTVVTQIWPCLKAILQITVQEADQMAALLTVADKISTTTARGSIYEACFTTSTTSAEAFKVVRHDLVALYQACLKLIAVTADLLEKNPLQRAAYCISHPLDAVKKAAGADFSSLEEQLARSVQAASAELECKLRLQIQELNTPVARIDERVSAILESVSVRDEQEILEWMSSVPYSSHHDAIIEKRMEGTCDWVLQHSKFQEWEASSGCTLLWLQGFSGTGKTFLTSRVIDHKKELLSRGPNDESLAFFYFNRSDASRNSALSCLQSLVRQLSNSCRRQRQMRPALKTLFQNCKREGRVLGRDLCTKQLAESIDLFPRTTIILDALDECNEDDREDLVKILDDLMKNSSRPVLVFISSRPDGDIRLAFRDRTSVEVGVEDNQDDIAKFVRDKIDNAGNRWRQIPVKTKTKVISTLLEKSQGMFRWTALQVYELLKLSHPNEVLDRLGKLPMDLKETYDEIYSKQGRNRTRFASQIIGRAIMWVMVAMEPVTSDILLSAVRIDPVVYIDTMVNTSSRFSITQHADEVPEDEDYIVTTEMDADQLLEYCANLLTRNPETDEWAFSHASVSEYFEEHHFSVSEAHGFVGSAGLVTLLDAYRSARAQRLVGAIKFLHVGPNEELYLLTSFLPSHIEDGSSPDEPDMEDERAGGLINHTFLRYVVKYWAEHVGLYDKSLSNQGDKNGTHKCVAIHDPEISVSPGGMGALLENFLGHPNDSSHACRFWLREQKKVVGWQWGGDIDASGMVFSIEWRRVNTKALVSFTMVRYGLFNLLQSWWQAPLNHDDGIDRETREHLGPLIDTTVRTEEGWSLLHLACCFDYLPIVEALLAAGLSASDEIEGFTALSMASERGHVKICRLLVEKGGCSPDWPNENGNPLYCAAQNRHVDVVRYLVSKNADPNRFIKTARSMYDSYHQSPLTVATKHGTYINVLRILIKEGKGDPNTAAIYAASYLNFEALEYLVHDAHVDVNAHVPNAPLTTVAIALISGVSNSYKYGESPDLIPRSRDLGVDFASVRDVGGLKYISDCGYDDSALESAVDDGDLELTQCLVEECEVDVNYPTRDGLGCALAGAADQRDLTDEHFRVLQYLLDKGADVNLQIPPGRNLDRANSPLAAAVKRNNVEVMRFLIKHGADVNLQLTHATKYGSALAWAAGNSVKHETVRCLLDHGADINLPLRHGYFGSALIVACAIDDDDPQMVKLLCEEGAHVNLQATHGIHGSALSCAAYKGHLSIVQCLLSYGADVNLVLCCGTFGSALIAACFRPWLWSDKKVLKLLCDQGADVNFQTTLGDYGSALSCAASEGRVADVQYLLDHGADVNLILHHRRFGGALMAAVGSIPSDYWNASGREDMVVFLLDNGADVNLQVDMDQDPDSAHDRTSSALMVAAEAGDDGLARLLIERGADVTRPENQRWEETLMFAMEEPRVWLYDDVWYIFIW